ncbi:hypothetical protein [Duganella violaceipulchra]|uniref:Uncharacterized protein n=1 Tax=Duganella violaceipulchra TaxID=2849652 RepID=A0AA41H7M1_9BURK|nr:hypothetical protein [Duganella violaceicalia]MBV6321256.1 hypothetical protein [Duganella violaceicalia]MCP2009496.1 hypothetical protein [Duganella violaceicalia]
MSSDSIGARRALAALPTLDALMKDAFWPFIQAMPIGARTYYGLMNKPLRGRI